MGNYEQGDIVEFKRKGSSGYKGDGEFYFITENIEANKFFGINKDGGVHRLDKNHNLFRGTGRHYDTFDDYLKSTGEDINDIGLTLKDILENPVYRKAVNCKKHARKSDIALTLHMSSGQKSPRFKIYFYNFGMLNKSEKHGVYFVHDRLYFRPAQDGNTILKIEKSEANCSWYMEFSETGIKPHESQLYNLISSHDGEKYYADWDYDKVHGLPYIQIVNGNGVWM